MSKYKTWLTAYVMLLPYLCFFAIFALYPIIGAIRVSFYKWSILGAKSFIGLKNYKRLLTDDMFLQSLLNTFYFVLITTPLFTIVALLLATLVNQIRRGKPFFRAVFYLPNILSVSVITSVWIFILRPYTGILSKTLKSFGIGEIFWLTDPGLAWVSIVMATLWWTVGFSFIIYLAGLQDIPESYYEAAALEGASRFQSFLHVTLPGLSRITMLVVVLQTIASFRIFGQVKLMTNGGPADSTRTTVLYMYQKSFERQELGYGATISVVLLVVIMLFTLAQFYVTRERK